MAFNNTGHSIIQSSDWTNRLKMITEFIFNIHFYAIQQMQQFFCWYTIDVTPGEAFKRILLPGLKICHLLARWQPITFKNKIIVLGSFVFLYISCIKPIKWQEFIFSSISHNIIMVTGTIFDGNNQNLVLFYDFSIKSSLNTGLQNLSVHL